MQSSGEQSVPKRGSMKGLSRKKFHLAANCFWQLAHAPLEIIRIVTVTSFLITVFVFAFALPDLNSRVRGHLKRANHGSICDSSLLVTGPMTISGYAWGHIVASGPGQLSEHPRG